MSSHTQPGEFLVFDKSNHVYLPGDTADNLLIISEYFVTDIRLHITRRLVWNVIMLVVAKKLLGK